MKPRVEDKKEPFAEIVEISRLGKLKTHLLIFSFILLLVSAVFEGFSFGLLVPFLKQAAGMGVYEGWKSMPVVGPLLQTLHFERVAQRIDWLLAVIIFAVCIRQVATYLSQILFNGATIVFEGRLRIAAYERMLGYGCLFFDNVKKGEIHNTLMRFTQEIAELMRSLFGMGQNIFFALIYVGVLVSISWQLALVATLIAPVFYFLLRGLFKVIHKLYKKILKHEQTAHGLSYDVFSNIKLVKAMVQENAETHKFAQAEQARIKDNVMAQALYSLIGPLQEILMTVGLAAIIWIGYNYFLKSDPSFLIRLIVSLLIFRRTIGVINSLFSNYPTVIRRYPYIQEYQKLMNPLGKSMISGGTQIFEELRQGIEYRAVSMQYSEGPMILKQLSFFLPAGSFTAIVGASGAGKTTLVELLPRFYEYQQGDILIDEVSIRDYDLKTLRSGIGFVSQDTLVLNDTIFNNIRYAKLDSSREEILLAAQQARVLEFTRNLEHGIDTLIGDRGVKLSGGELQRLSIARVMLSKPRLLILDEATSALDSLSEKCIQEALNELSQGRTVIAIAHRLSTIQHADQILVLEKGSIVEQGAPQELLQKKNFFYRYWQAQYFGA